MARLHPGVSGVVRSAQKTGRTEQGNGSAGEGMVEIHGEGVEMRPGLEQTNPLGFACTAWPLRSRRAVMLLTDEARTKHA